MAEDPVHPKFPLRRRGRAGLKPAGCVFEWSWTVGLYPFRRKTCRHSEDRSVGNIDGTELPAV